MKIISDYFVYLLVRLFVGTFGRLPWPVLHKISDVLAWLLIHVIQYRKSVIYANLERCFPEKTIAERTDIARRFYIHFADLLVEVLKSNYLTAEEAQERLGHQNIDAVNAHLDSGKNAIGIMGHFANWEWLAHASKLLHKQFIAIYKPLRNPAIDKWMRKIRSQSNCALLPTYETKKWFADNPDKAFLAGFIADQSPGDPNKAVWVNFFGQPTAFLPGGVLLAKEYKMLIFYCRIWKKSRSKYQFEFEVMTKDAQDYTTEELIQQFAQLLEADIRKQPECWLWSHKRWKLTPPIA